MSAHDGWGPVAAAALGRVAGETVELALDRAERVSLWALEQAAVVQPDSALVHTAERGIRRLRPLTAPLPRTARRATAAATYLAIRTAPGVVRVTRRLTAETASFVGPGGRAWRD
jgi:hypothetical protein